MHKFVGAKEIKIKEKKIGPFICHDLFIYKIKIRMPTGSSAEYMHEY